MRKVSLRFGAGGSSRATRGSPLVLIVALVLRVILLSSPRLYFEADVLMGGNAWVCGACGASDNWGTCRCRSCGPAARCTARDVVQAV